MEPRIQRELDTKHLMAVHRGVALDVLRGQPIRAYVSSQQSDTAPLECQVWRISPFGMDVIWQNNFAPLSSGAVDVTVVIGKQHISLKAVLAGEQFSENGASLIALRFLQENHAPRSGQIQRAADRWRCDTMYPPTGETLQAERFNSLVYFRLVDISRDGAQAVTSLRNNFLVPGLTLKCRIHFPTAESVKVDVTVMHVRRIDGESGEGCLALGVRWAGRTAALHKQAGQYLLQFGKSEHGVPTLSALKKSGLQCLSAARGVDFSYVRSETDFQEVLQLRLTAFREVVPTAKDATPSDWSDMYDSRARILIGRHRGKIVASCRIVYPSDTEELEHEHFVKMPQTFPKRSDIVECGRVCVDPGFRGQDLLIALFRYVVVTTLESGRSHLLSNCTQHLLKMYESIGCRRTGLEFIHPKDGSQHFLCMMNFKKAICGIDIHPVKWHALFGEMWDQLEDFHPKKLSLIGKARLATLLMARPGLAKIIQRKAVAPTKVAKR
ncbi:MAG: GNAT family N-acetyltransferase [Cytophagaceae bacterium]|nr:MAG: GNAT family N-acetyltransferase [Cytophagaceae bacterium]